MVDSASMPDDVMDFCLDNEISTHYQNDIVFILNNDNTFANWLREMGYVFSDDEGDWIGIMST